MEIRLAYYKSTSSSWFIAKEKLLNHWLEKMTSYKRKFTMMENMENYRPTRKHFILVILYTSKLKKPFKILRCNPNRLHNTFLNNLSARSINVLSIARTLSSRVKRFSRENQNYYWETIKIFNNKSNFVQKLTSEIWLQKISLKMLG